MQQICQITNQPFEITDQDLEFYRKINVPPPVLCPEERLRRRLLWRNDSTLYYRNCDKTGKRILSMFSPDSKIRVYNQEFWWGDSWDGTDYGRSYDFNRPFFEQFHDLNKSVPHMALISMKGENSDFTNYVVGNKNCYMSFAGNNSEDCYYSYNAESCKDCSDCLFVWDSELCYDCVHCDKCYNCTSCAHCKNCVDSHYLEDCTGCHNCFMCFNLARKQYYILNQPCNKEDYFKKIKELRDMGTATLRQMWLTERSKHPKIENHNVNAENCTGDYILNSKNCNDCYIMAKGCEDCKFILNGFPGLKDSYDCCYSGADSNLMYETMGSGIGETMILFGNLCLNGSSYLQYCSYAMNSKHCFGCSNIRNKSYCILNKQYTKEAYEELVPRIIEHMKSTGEYGLFFSPETSPFKPEETNVSWYF